jgi:hypothetical protein
VRRLSGEGKVYNELRLNDTVAKLKKIILADMKIILADNFYIDVLLEGKQLGAQCTLKEVGLRDGSEVTVVLIEDDMPACIHVLTLSGEEKVYTELRLNDTGARLKEIILADMTITLADNFLHRCPLGG